jgi:hypothetical protein
VSESSVTITWTNRLISARRTVTGPALVLRHATRELLKERRAEEIQIHEVFELAGVPNPGY